MADQLYYDNGYADVGYVLRILDATVPAGRYVDPDYHLDGYIEDQPETAFSVSVTAGKFIFAECDITAQTTTTSLARVLVQGTPNVIQNNFSVPNTDSIANRRASSDIAAAFAVATTATNFVRPDDSEFTWDDQDASWVDWYGEVWEPSGVWITAGTITTASSGKILGSGSLDISSAFATSADAVITLSGTSAISSAFATSTDARLKLGGSSDISAEFSISAQGDPYDLASASITSEFAVSADAVLTLSGTSAVSSEFTVAATGGYLHLATATSSSAFSISTVGSLIRDAVPHDIAMSSSVSTVATKFVGATVEDSSAFTVSTTANSIFSSTSAIESEFSLTARAAEFQRASAALSAEFAKTTTARILRNADVAISNELSLTVDAREAQVRADSAITSEFAVTAIPTRIQPTDTSINLSFTVTAAGSFFGTVPLYRTITVPQDTRIVQTLPESRIITVDSETLINIVTAENRQISVDQETRNMKILTTENT